MTKTAQDIIAGVEVLTIVTECYGGGEQVEIFLPSSLNRLIIARHDATLQILPVLQQSGGVGNSLTYSSPTGIPSGITGNASFSTSLLNPTWTSPTWTSPTWTSPT